MQWSAYLPSRFHVSRRTLDPTRGTLDFIYGAITLCSRPSHAARLSIVSSHVVVHTPTEVGLGSSAFARRYLRNRLNLSFPLGTKMFQFPRCFPVQHKSDRWLEITPAGFPHSDIGVSKLTSSSTPLIAGSRVLHRLLVPRHPLYALKNLTS